MADERIMDVHCEFDLLKLMVERDPTRTIAEVSKRTAEEQAALVGGTLRHPDPREVIVKRAMTPFGNDVFLVATRWVVDGVRESAGV